MTHTAEDQSMAPPHKPFLKMLKKQKSSSSTPPGSEKNFFHDGRGNVIAESSMSGESEATTALVSSSSGIGGSVCISGNGSERIVSGTNCTEPVEVCDGDQWTNTRRRHAINITSNPGYQVLHSSHSTLDRTCSDGVMSVKVRKSTSDLVNAGIEKTSATAAPIAATPRRRGSSKGGLAYLASRRGSRESMKSAVSNSSIFSNEDIGPLTFQSSQRGRQRRTSNFLELPGKCSPFID